MLEELYLIRHAMPDRSTGVPYNIMPGPPLTPIGQQEAVQTAFWLGGRGIPDSDSGHDDWSRRSPVPRLEAALALRNRVRGDGRMSRDAMDDLRAHPRSGTG